MPPDKPKRIQVVTYEEDSGIRGGGMARVTKPLDVSILRDRFRDFISGFFFVLPVFIFITLVGLLDEEVNFLHQLLFFFNEPLVTHCFMFG